jgi:competence protein ComGC
MPLTPCPECAHEVSDVATACPSCGYPLAPVEQKKTPKGLWWALGCLVAIPVMFVVVAMIGLLAAIAIPSFVKARDTSQRNACINNMRQIDAAMEQAAMEHNYMKGDSISEHQMSEYIKGGWPALVCPAGGTYTAGSYGIDPECSVHGSLGDTATGYR